MKLHQKKKSSSSLGVSFQALNFSFEREEINRQQNPCLDWSIHQILELEQECHAIESMHYGPISDPASSRKNNIPVLQVWHIGGC